MRILICPVSSNTNDANALSEGRLIPRIAGITNRYGKGMVSSYIGNGQTMGNRASNSLRYQDLNKRSMLLGEGADYGEVGKQYMPGLCFNAGPGGNAYSSAGTFNYANAYVGSNYIRGNNVAFSFMHDDTTEIWASYKSSRASYAFVRSFNKAYYPNAAASYDYGAPEHKKFSLASSIYPGDEWLNFRGILNRFRIPRILVAKFHPEDVEFGYGFGEMNVLTADFAVSKRHQGWMYENWRELSYYGNE